MTFNILSITLHGGLGDAGRQRVKVHKEPELVHFKNDSPDISDQMQDGRYTDILGGGKVMQLQPVARLLNCAAPRYTCQYRSVTILRTRPRRFKRSIICISKICVSGQHFFGSAMMNAAR